MATSSAPLRRCPVCRYHLEGLPASHQCPECGFAYDETMKLWWVPVIPAWMLVVTAFLAYAMIGTYFGGVFRNGLGLNRSESVAAVVFLSAAIPFALQFLFPRGFVAIGRKGLSYKFPWRPLRIIPWNEIRVGGLLRVVYRVHAGVQIPVRLPTVGLPRRRKVAIHKQIARRRDEISSGSAPVIGQSDVKP